MSHRYAEAAGNDLATVTVGRSLALLAALLWAFAPGYGLIDLSTAVPPGDPGFRTHWFLEGIWGLFTTVLVAAPLLAAALRPARAPPLPRPWPLSCSRSLPAA